MPSLSERQQMFAVSVAKLILFINEQGYGCTFGEAFRTPMMAEYYARTGQGIKNSLHLQRLAIDLNLFKDGVYLPTTKAHTFAGEYWESLHPDNRWGGRFGDGNHYSMTFGSESNVA